jgi:predicted ATPase
MSLGELNKVRGELQPPRVNEEARVDRSQHDENAGAERNVKLVKATIRRYRSIESGASFEVEDAVTCLVGKNESGKTAVLQALFKSNPIETGAKFDEVLDFPTRLTRERRDTTDGIAVTRLTYELSDTEVASVEAEFGEGVLTSRQIEVETGYRYTGTLWTIKHDEAAAVEHLRAELDVPPSAQAAADAATTAKALVEALSEMETSTASARAVIQKVGAWRDSNLHRALIEHMKDWRPAFVYFGDYDSMPGKVSIPDLIARRDTDSLLRGEQALLSLLNLAGVELEDFEGSGSHEHLIRDLENASNSISDEIFEYWSQNTDLAVELRSLGSAEPGAAAPLNAPPLLQIRVENQRHRVSVPFDERSRGFVWFFSFLAYFDQLERAAADRPLILLLDEPGLNLHAKAQADLLRFIDDRLAPKHQVLYTTHSPFMINAHKLNRVRVVVDEPTTGTVLSGEVLRTDAETAFPLHAALGIELSQTLFVGPDVLLVEGPAELAYLEVLSTVLKAATRTGLDDGWVITPAGGAGKLPAFVTLLGANRLNTVVLVDSSVTDTTTVDRLRQAGQLGAGGMVLIGDVLGAPVADTEDLFEPAFYVDLVNRAYAGLLAGSKLTVRELPKDARLVRRVERAFEARGLNNGRINHYAPAKALLRQPELHEKISSRTLDLAEELFRRINAFIPGHRS